MGGRVFGNFFVKSSIASPQKYLEVSKDNNYKFDIPMQTLGWIIGGIVLGLLIIVILIIYYTKKALEKQRRKLPKGFLNQYA